CYADDECIQRVQAIQDLHQNGQGWVDIGYHFLVGENGKVYEGKGWNCQAAHSSGWNNDAYDVSSSKMTYDLNEKNSLFFICIIGDFKTSFPSEKALEATRLWIDCGIERGHNGNVLFTCFLYFDKELFSRGNSTFTVVKRWSRFCSLQNFGANLTGNEIQLSIGRNFCEKELELSSSSAHLIITIILFHLLFIYSI
ncbi:unnamed protein product, partial [Rotaria sp. Silwood1]